MRSGPNFFGDCTQSGPESQDQTVSRSRLDWTVKSFFGPVSKFGTGLLTNQSGPVRSVYPPPSSPPPPPLSSPPPRNTKEAEMAAKRVAMEEFKENYFLAVGAKEWNELTAEQQANGIKLFKIFWAQEVAG